MTHKEYLIDMWNTACNAIYLISDSAETFESEDENECEDVQAIKELCDKLIEVIEA